MTGERLACLSLRLDAAYCIALGLVIAVTAPVASGPLALPTPALMVVGIATAAWGVLVAVAAQTRPLRANTRFVMVANIAASLVLVASGMAAGTALLAIAALVLAVDVAAFAASQGVALRRMA